MAPTTLRDFRETDLDRLVALANDEEVSRYLMHTFPFPYTRADGEWWISTGSTQPGTITRAIENDGQLAGGVGIKLQTGWRSHLGEIGYWVARSYWRQGVGKAALEQMTEYGFSERGFEKLYAPVLGPNVASMKLLTKCGYVLEGILRSEVRKHGRSYDLHLFARYRP